METQEMKQRIKDYFVEIKEDKFTKVKSIKCKHKIEWKGKELENKFMLTKDSYSNSLSMSIDYRHKGDTDSVFFGFTYSNSEGGYPEMTNIKMYLILDDDKTIELSDASGFDHASQSSNVGDNYITVYIETAQLAVSMSDFIAIANANKIEYSIRFGQGGIENTLSQNDLILFKGFYNAAFDNDFELSFISASIKDKILQIEMLSKLQVYNMDKDYRQVKDEIDIEHFKFKHYKSPILLDKNENILFSVYPYLDDKTRPSVLITNKRIYTDDSAKLKYIELIGKTNFEVRKSWLGVIQLIEQATSYKLYVSDNELLVNDVCLILNSLINLNNDLK
jgi:hypothetical protein